jgi:hypothetical protein
VLTRAQEAVPDALVSAVPVTGPAAGELESDGVAEALAGALGESDWL